VLASKSGLLRSIQTRLERFYGLERSVDVRDFVREVADDQRETLLVRESDDGVEVALLLPRRALEPHAALDADTVLQVVEGVSHLVYLAERVRTRLPTTRLELELQAEVDKFVLLALDRRDRFAEDHAALHEVLYERVRYLHDPSSEDGARYRLANELASRYVRRFGPGASDRALLAELRRFYRAGQAEKIRLARAA